MTDWQPMETAPRTTREWVLLAFKQKIPSREESYYQGKQMVMRYDSDNSEWGGWGYLGNGGFPDDWFAGWKPLDEHPETQGPDSA